MELASSDQSSPLQTSHVYAACATVNENGAPTNSVNTSQAVMVNPINNTQNRSVNVTSNASSPKKSDFNWIVIGILEVSFVLLVAIKINYIEIS
jgi:hypothetical protein